MNDTPINFEVVSKAINESNLENVGKASIREIKKLVDVIEKQTGEKFIRMEMGIPGLPPTQVGVNAEIEALKKGVASIYPDIQGIPLLKTEASRFHCWFSKKSLHPATHAIHNTCCSTTKHPFNQGGTWRREAACGCWPVCRHRRQY